jgi:hypothetical protein
MTEHYQTEHQIAAVVVGFEDCTTGKEDFTHLSHLTIATYYLRGSTADEAFEKMRSGLFRFLDHHAIARGKYDEQVTRRWLTLVQDVIAEMNSHEASLVEITNTVLERLGDSRIVVRRENETN